MGILALSVLDLEGFQVQKVFVSTALVASSCADGAFAAAHSLVCFATHPSLYVGPLLPWVEEL